MADQPFQLDGQQLAKICKHTLPAWMMNYYYPNYNRLTRLSRSFSQNG